MKLNSAEANVRAKGKAGCFRSGGGWIVDRDSEAICILLDPGQKIYREKSGPWAVAEPQRA